jgi:Holliday junction DNA helicase RuvA
MIGSLRGRVLDRWAEGEVLIEVHGIGYRVVVTPATLAGMDVGAEAFLHVHHHIREDAQTLYGFPTRDERMCFEALLGAHRVGPALALAILGTFGPVELRRVVANGDVAGLCLVPGVGKQTAARLLIELKSRLDVPELDVDTVGDSGGRASASQTVAEALAGLGYAPDEIREALRSVPEGPDNPERLLRDALSVLGAARA